MLMICPQAPIQFSRTRREFALGPGNKRHTPTLNHGWYSKAEAEI